MSLHRFNLGQLVKLAPSTLRAAAPGAYEICRLIPAVDRSPDDPCYRIRNLAERHERAAPESELTPAASVSS